MALKRNIRNLMVLAGVVLAALLSSDVAGQGGRRLLIPFGKQSAVVYQLDLGTFTVSFRGKARISNAYAECRTTAVVSGKLAGERTYTQKTFQDALGKGTLYTITDGANTGMQQLFYVYEGKEYMLTEVRLPAKSGSCVYMSPLMSNEVNLSDSGDNRALFVPFDNDMWVRYNAEKLENARFTGSEVGAFYNNDTRVGLVAGSLEHAVWKSGITYVGSRENNKASLSVFAGFTDADITHDKLPHGKPAPVNGYSRSPRMMIGWFSDWRDGMEQYAVLNGLLEPRTVFKWNEPAPMGWNSWGVIQAQINLEKSKRVADFFHDSCAAFRTADKTLYIDLDSFWDNMANGGIDGDLSALREFAGYCKSKGLKPGIYWAPFVDWGKSSRKIEGSSYDFSQTWIKQNGQVMDIDGARAMDPTHPGTRDRIKHVLTKFKELGFQMIKIDFLGHAALEADAFYDPAVTTGMQAFRSGMELVDSVLDGKMLVYAAISPNLATARYVHMRRIGCDAFSNMEHTEYTLNSAGYGWWQGSLYDFIDGDHVVFGKEHLHTNRARLTSSLVTGTLITGDDFATPGIWQQRAMSLLQNKHILELARTGKSFRPSEANTGNKGVSVFSRKSGNNWYVAIVNYSAELQNYSIPLQRLGITESKKMLRTTELFSGKESSAGKSLKVRIEPEDAVIFKIGF